MYQYLHADCFQYMPGIQENSIAAIITDPPYGVKEYTAVEIEKKHNGSGGIWRIPQCFDGHKRQPVPRFSVINDDAKERQNVFDFFYFAVIHDKERWITRKTEKKSNEFLVKPFPYSKSSNIFAYKFRHDYYL